MTTKFLDLEKWPEGLIRLFESKAEKGGNVEDRYFGPYNTLLNRCLDIGDDTYQFFVASEKSMAQDERDEALDFSQVELIVRDCQARPVLIVLVKDGTHISFPSTRLSASEQIGKLFGSLIQHCPLKRLYAISFMGTRMRVCHVDVESMRIEPYLYAKRPPQFDVLPSTFMKDEWKLDVLSQEGFESLKAIVKDIRSMADLPVE